MNKKFVRVRLGGKDAVWNRLRYDRDGLIEASAGTGKTYALQSIVLKLLTMAEGDEAIDVKNILLVTYTEKAAGELKDRIRAILEEAEILPVDFEEVTICTIHSFCRQLLAEYAFENGMPMTLELGASENNLIHQAVRETLLSQEFAKEFAATFERELDEYATADKLVEKAELALKVLVGIKKPGAAKDGEEKFAQVLAARAKDAYLRLKKESSLLTFDDLIKNASCVIEREAAHEEAGEASALLGAIRRRYRIALVDEFQDTDDAQWKIFESLFSSRVNKLGGENAPCPRQGCLIVVGDPKQSIYGFRNANIATYLQARKAICAEQEVQTLAATYRSTRELVAAFNHFFGKTDWFATMAEGGERITYSDVVYPEENVRFAGLEDLTGRAAVTLLESLPVQQPPPKSSRTGNGNKALCRPHFIRMAAREMRRLRALPVAYRTTDPDTNEVCNHTLTYRDMCVLVRDHADDVRTLLACEGIPCRSYKAKGLYTGVEAESLLALFDFLAQPGGRGNLAALLLTPLFAIPPTQLEATLVQGNIKVMNLLEKWQLLNRARQWGVLFESILASSRLAHPTSNDLDFDRRWSATRQILDQLLAHVGLAARTIEDFATTLRQWGATLQPKGDSGIEDDIRQQENDDDCVQVITMHSAKGLEYKVVFIADGFSGDATDDEEKRVYYVALTRAELKLYLPWSRWATHTEILPKGKGSVTVEGIGSPNSPLDNGFLAQGILAHFAAQGQCADEVVVTPAPICKDAPTPMPAPCGDATLHAVPTIYTIPNLKNRRFHFDSFTSLTGNSSPLTRPQESAALPATMLPRTSASGTIFHEVMRELCTNDEAVGRVGFAIGRTPFAEATKMNSPLLDLIRRVLKRNAFSNRTTTADSTEQTLARMVWYALNTPLVFGAAPFYLKDIPRADRMAEVEFTLDEAAALACNLPHHEGVFNGSIDLLVRPNGPHGKVYIIDWKTTSLPTYSPDFIRLAMEQSSYPLQLKLYSLAAAHWLGENSLAGVAYLFVRAGELNLTSGIYTQDITPAFLNTCRDTLMHTLIPNGDPSWTPPT